MRSARDLPWAESFLVVTLLAATIAVAWTGLGRPPPHLVFRYGPPPGGSPTGREREIRGLRFVEISSGYFLDLPVSVRRPSSLPARFGPELGLSRRRRHDDDRNWVERTGPIWISAAPVTNRQIEALYPDRERAPPDAGPHDPALGLTEREELERARVYARWLGLGTDRDVRVATPVELAFARAIGLIPATESDTLRLVNRQ